MLGVNVSLYTSFFITRVFANAPKKVFLLKKPQNLMEKAGEKSYKNNCHVFLNGDSAKKIDNAYCYATKC